jgi:hypothetical protein
MKAKQFGSCVCLILLLSVSSNCGNLGLGRQGQPDTVKRETKDRSDDRLYYLDISNPSLSQPIDPASDQVESAKFVQVEVAEVVNPKKYGLTFDVYYQPTNDAKIWLGTFTLYPADNPGKFIVATQGKLRNEGTIVLGMVITDKVEANDQVKVGIKRIRFIKAPQ